MTDTEVGTVPLWALKFILDKGEFCDCGPHGEGWPSEHMKDALRAIEDAVYGDSLVGRQHTDKR
jgi:hypothetical protein